MVKRWHYIFSIIINYLCIKITIPTTNLMSKIRNINYHKTVVTR